MGRARLTEDAMDDALGGDAVALRLMPVDVDVDVGVDVDVDVGLDVDVDVGLDVDVGVGVNICLILGLLLGGAAVMGSVLSFKPVRSAVAADVDVDVAVGVDVAVTGDVTGLTTLRAAAGSLRLIPDVTPMADPNRCVVAAAVAL